MSVVKVRGFISTPYGEGFCICLREADDILLVALPFGVLYTKRSRILCNESDLNWFVKDETELEKQRREQKTDKKGTAGYEALEKMRKLNLLVSYNERGIGELNKENVDYYCASCLLSIDESKMKSGQAKGVLNRFVRSQTKRRCYRKGKPCLTCGNTTCPDHTSSEYNNGNITICLKCQYVLTLDFCADCLISDKYSRTLCMDRILAIYDRTRFLLDYVAKFIYELATDLEEAKVRQNLVGVGSSSVGIASGAMGVAAATAIFTPAVSGTLLMASLLFGGGAAVVQAGTEFRHCYGDSNQLADHIITLYGMAQAILRVVGILRDALMRCYIRTDVYKEKRAEDEYLDMKGHTGKFKAGIAISRSTFAGVEIGSLAQLANTKRMIVGARNIRNFTRTTGSTLMKTAQIASLVGGALSGAAVILEFNFMILSIEAIKSGNVCEKARILRKIRDDIESLPTTNHLEEECTNYLNTLSQRDRALQQDEVVQILLQHFLRDDEMPYEFCLKKSPSENDETCGFSSDLSNSDASLFYSSEFTMYDRHGVPSSLQQNHYVAEPDDNAKANLLRRIELYKNRFPDDQ